jgi:hypothetical protein
VFRKCQSIEVSVIKHDVSLVSCLARFQRNCVHLCLYSTALYHTYTMAEDDFIPLDPSSSTGGGGKGRKLPRSERVK